MRTFEIFDDDGRNPPQSCEICKSFNQLHMGIYLQQENGRYDFVDYYHCMTLPSIQQKRALYRIKRKFAITPPFVLIIRNRGQLI